MKKYLLSIFLLCLGINLNAQTIYYVSASGLNSNDGLSLGSSLATVARAHNIASSGDVIIISGNVSHNELVSINKDISIEGVSNATLSPDGSRSGTNRMFFVGTSGLTVNFKDITFSGNTDTTLIGSVFGMNQSSNITFDTCIFTGNSTISGVDGGVMFFNSGDVTITDSEFLNNTSGKNAGAISVVGQAGVLNITGSLFDGNSANRGGALSIAGNDRQLVMTTSTFVNNTAVSLDGGGMYLTGTNSNSSIKNCTFFNNSVTYTVNQSKGGAIRIAGARPITIENCLIYGNTATDGTNTANSDIGAIPDVELNLINSITKTILPVQEGTGDELSTSIIAADLTASNLRFNATSGKVEYDSVDEGIDSPIDFGSDGNDAGSWDSGLTLSLERDKLLSSKLDVYFNSLDKKIQIRHTIDEPLSIDIYSILGAKILSSNNVKNEQEFLVNNAKSGIYLIRATTKNKYFSKKIVID